VYESVTDEFTDNTNPIFTKLCMDVSHTNEVMTIL